MADDEKRIAIISPNGQFGTISAKHAEAVTRAGGRVLTKQEVAEHELQEQYDKQSAGQKIAGAAKMFGPLGWGANLAAGSPMTTPTLEAYTEGVKQGATAGMGSAIQKGIIGETQGAQAAQAFARRTDQLQQASPVAHGAGEFVGMVAPALAGAAGAVAPAGAISLLGGAAEAGAGAAARALGYEGASVLGRTGLAAAQMGARGAVEGGAYAASQYAGDALLHDVPMTTDKLFAATGTGALYGGAGGFLLGGAGKLAAEGAGAVRGGLARAMSAPGEATAEAVGRAAGAAEEAGGLKGLVGDMTTEAGVKGRAYDSAWAAIGSGRGLQTTEFAKRAARYLDNGTRDVGEWLMRKGIINPKAGILEAAREATPEAMLPKIQAQVEADGRRIGEITGASDGRVQATDILKAVADVATPYDASAATRPIGRSLWQFGGELADSLGLKAGAESVSVQDLLRERKALDLMVFENAALDPAMKIQVKRELRTKLEALVVDALDRSSGKLKGEMAAEYKALKRDYLAGNIALDAAEDSAARDTKNATFSLTDKLIAGAAGSAGAAIGGPIGGLIAGPGAAFASKVVRQRGSAVMASQLYQAAERGTLAKFVQKVDDQIGKASKGLLQPPAKGLLKPADQMPATKVLAKTALARVAEFQADPEAFVDKATRQTESLNAHSPELASAMVARQVQALTFLAGKLPQVPDPDPMDPHPAPRMTPNEEAELGRYAWYVEKPARFFGEVARGKVTYEGAEVAKALAPTAFEQLQQRTLEAISEQMAKGVKLPYRQRQIIGVLMDVAATPSQRPDHAAFLQKNVLELEPPPAPAPKRSGSPVTSTQRSALDRLEATGPGRH
jgi:hypothetical protein